MKTTFKSTLTESQSTVFLKDEAQIKQWLDDHQVKHYTINEDMTVSVQGPLTLNEAKLEEIPVKFSEVAGSIDVTSNTLKRIDWAPAHVHGSFECWDNEIETLEGGPTEVDETFDCDTNKLVNLHGGPTKVGGAYVCSKNPLVSFAGCPKAVGKYFKAQQCSIAVIDDFPHTVGTNVYLQNCHITSFKGINKFLKKINGTTADKLQSINITGNPVQSGLLSLVSVEGVKKIICDAHTKTYDELENAIDIVNNGLSKGEDALDIQERLIDADLGNFS